jgi:hypothetical protein
LIERFFIVIDGILVFHGLNKTKKCFCPPNYFGDQCQWQNQRIILTLQLFSREIVSNKMTFQLTGVSQWGVVGAVTPPQCLKVLFFLLDGLWTVLKILRNILQDFQKFLIILYNVEKNFKKTSKIF